MLKPEDKLQKLREKGITVYSFSRLGTHETCPYEYYNTYILKNRGIENIYTLLGSEIHQNKESIYKGESDRATFKKNFENKIIELEMLNYKFPNEKTAESWKRDMFHYVNNFKIIDKKAVLEQLIVFEIDGIWLQGYIDVIFPSNKGKPYVNVVDWKSSSKFSGKKLTEAGRQLIMYKLGLEATTNFKVDKVMWGMLKYLNVCWKLKNGKTKKKMCNRGKWVKEMRNTFAKDMYKLEMEDFEIELLLDKAEEENSIECLPEEIKEKYWVEDCFVEYEITDEKIEEFKQYVKDTVREIESKDPNNEDEWEGVEITKYNSFYCSNLCGHRKTCKYYKTFLDENADSFEKKEKKDKMSFENLFG